MIKQSSIGLLTTYIKSHRTSNINVLRKSFKMLWRIIPFEKLPSNLNILQSLTAMVTLYLCTAL